MPGADVTVHPEPDGYHTLGPETVQETGLDPATEMEAQRGQTQPAVTKKTSKE